MGVEPKIGGKTPKWMVKIMENPIKMDDLGAPLFLKTPILMQRKVENTEYFHLLVAASHSREGSCQGTCHSEASLVSSYLSQVGCNRIH